MNLTDADRDVLIEAAHPSRPDREQLLIGHVEAIVARRVAAAVQATTESLRALADEWDAELRAEYRVGDDWTDKHARALRAALAGSTDPTPDTRIKAETDRPSLAEACTCRGGPHGGYTCPGCRGAR